MKQIMNEWREFMTKRNKREVGSCIIVDNKDRVLILKRSATDDWKPGWWDLPGGHLDGGETPIEGAEREAREESGLTVRNLQKIETVHMGNIFKHFFVTRDWDGVVRLEENPETGEVEHDDYKWATLDELRGIKESIVLEAIVKKGLDIVRV
jgi:8-oxo-dGTP diphosphatase